ncbi:MAG: tripartite tricarboxylate transporter substrate binding protein [Xanthobacteraceae bacterium]|nr:tripartite tricarboxylate transporter substrate binding protein [Xanthobacteraceae bacterium]
MAKALGRFGLAALALLALSAGASAQDYPAKPIRMVVPYPAGGVVDFVARQIGQQMTVSMGQPLVVENRVGASGSIATEAMAKSAPDGYSIMLVFDTHAVNPHVYKNLRYDTFKDLTAVSLVAQIPLAFMSHRGFGANTVADVVRMAKEKPGTLSYGSTGPGTSGHLAGEQFKLSAGVDILHVPYRGGAPLLTGLLGEQIPLAVAAPTAFLSNIADGKLKALAVTGKQRSPALPNVPTMIEAGYPALDSGAWIGVVVTAGTPPAVVERLNREVAKAVKDPALSKIFLEQMIEPVGSTPAAFEAFLRAEHDKWGKVIKDAKLDLQP